MGIQGIQSTYKAPLTTINTPPWYGMSTVEVATEAVILGLTGRGTTSGTYLTSFTLNATTGLYQYFAYPVSYGACQFLDTDSGFIGGWDGANNDIYSLSGPIVMDIHVGGQVVPFYVYRTDHEGLTLCHWTTQPAS